MVRAIPTTDAVGRSRVEAADPGSTERAWHRHLLRGSTAVVLNVGIQGAGGFAFWFLAARRFTPEDVGSAQALFTSLLAVTWLSALGLPFAVARHCRDDDPTSRINFVVAAGLTSCGSLVAGVVYLVWDDEFVPAAASTLTPPLFLAAAVGMSLAVLVEIRLMALRRWRWVIGRAVALVGLRLPLFLVGIETQQVLWLFAAIAGTPALTGFIGTAALMGRHRSPMSLHRTQIEHFVRAAGSNLPALLATQAPNFLVPFVVASRIDSEDYAPFYLAWGIAMIVSVVPYMLGQTLLVEAFKDRAQLNSQAGSILVWALAVTSGATAVTAMLAPLLPRLLGDEYVALRTVAPILVGASIPWAVTVIAIAIARAHDRHGRVLLLTTIFCLTALITAWISTREHDMTSAAIGWMLANVITAGAAALSFRRWPHRERHQDLPMDSKVPPRDG